MASRIVVKEDKSNNNCRSYNKRYHL